MRILDQSEKKKKLMNKNISMVKILGKSSQVKKKNLEKRNKDEKKVP
jgi:hypothetical protein